MNATSIRACAFIFMLLWSGLAAAQLKDISRTVGDSLKKSISVKIDSAARKAWSGVETKKKEPVKQLHQ